MRCGGTLVGALGVGHKDGRVPLSTEDEQLLLAVMAQASLAYENARLYGALAERLEEIRSLQRYQENVIRSSSSGIVVLDREDLIHSANPAFAQLTGRDEKLLVGLPFRQVLPGLPDELLSGRRPRADLRGPLHERDRRRARRARLRSPPSRAIRTAKSCWSTT